MFGKFKIFWYDEVSRLMHDFFCKDPKDMHNAVLARNVRHYKTEKEGVETMYSASEEIRNEENAKRVKNLMKNLDLSFEEACNALEIPAEDRPTIKELMQQL